MQKVRYFILSITMCALVTPSIASAYISKTLRTEGDFQTQEELEQTCRKLVGLRETGTGTLLYQMRRCIQRANQRKAAEAEATSRTNRQTIRRSRLDERSNALQRQTERMRERLLKQNLQLRYRQADGSAVDTRSSFRDIRSRRRVKIQSRGRDIQKKLQERVELQRKANILCGHYSGAQKVMCVREKMRGEQENDY